MYSINIISDSDCSNQPIELGRYYWAVGPGLFTSQRMIFPTKKGPRVFHMVYDCGTNAKQSYVEREIDEYLNSVDEDIDILFVSHLDRDHISGIQYLANSLASKNKVIKNIYYPFVEKSELFYLAANPANHGVQNILFNIRDYFNELAENVVEVPSEDGNQDINATFILCSNTAAKSHTIWNFSFTILTDYSIRRSGFYDTLAALLNISKNSLLQNISNSSFRNDLFMHHKHLLIRSYRSQRGLKNLNNSSLCLYSGPPESKLIKYQCHRSNFMSPNFNTLPQRGGWSPKPGWIGTGDAPLKSLNKANDFNNLFFDLIPHCESITVPHHGSIKNWNNQILHFFPNGTYCFIGANGLYGHPHFSVIKAINALGHMSINMTENPNTRFAESYSIYYK